MTSFHEKVLRIVCFKLD